MLLLNWMEARREGFEPPSHRTPDFKSGAIPGYAIAAMTWPQLPLSNSFPLKSFRFRTERDCSHGDHGH